MIDAYRHLYTQAQMAAPSWWHTQYPSVPSTLGPPCTAHSLLELHLNSLILELPDSQCLPPLLSLPSKSLHTLHSCSYAPVFTGQKFVYSLVENPLSYKCLFRIILNLFHSFILFSYPVISYPAFPLSLALFPTLPLTCSFLLLLSKAW